MENINIPEYEIEGLLPGGTTNKKSQLVDLQLIEVCSFCHMGLCH